jgi:hypothetical protein
MHFQHYLGTMGATCLYALLVSRSGKDQSITLPWKRDEAAVPRRGVTGDGCTETFVPVGNSDASLPVQSQDATAPEGRRAGFTPPVAWPYSRLAR